MAKYYLEIGHDTTNEGYDSWIEIVGKYNTLQKLIGDLKDHYEGHGVFKEFENMTTEEDVTKFIKTLIAKYKNGWGVFIFKKIIDDKTYNIIYNA